VHGARHGDALFDLAHAGQVLVELLPVAAVELGVQRLRIREHVVEDGMLLALAALEVGDAFIACAVTEQALEGELRIVLRCQRLVRRRPRQLYS
jgi:hypothetical protein